MQNKELDRRVDTFLEQHADQLRFTEAKLAFPVRYTDWIDVIQTELTEKQNQTRVSATLLAIQPNIKERFCSHQNDTYSHEIPNQLSEQSLAAIRARITDVRRRIHGKTGWQVIQNQIQNRASDLRLRAGDRLKQIPDSATEGKSIKTLDEWLFSQAEEEEEEKKGEGEKTLWGRTNIVAPYIPEEGLQSDEHGFVKMIFNHERPCILPKQIKDALYLNKNFDLKTVYDETLPKEERPKTTQSLDLKPGNFIFISSWISPEDQKAAFNKKIEQILFQGKGKYVLEKNLHDEYAKHGLNPFAVTLYQVRELTENGIIIDEYDNNSQNAEIKINEHGEIKIQVLLKTGEAGMQGAWEIHQRGPNDTTPLQYKITKVVQARV